MDRVFCCIGVYVYESIYCVEGVEKEMRIKLAFKVVELGGVLSGNEFLFLAF